jgi:hypothetical protein
MSETEDKKSSAEPEAQVDDDFAGSVSRLTKMMRKQNSLSRRFLAGMVFGVGSAIGATVIAAALVIVLSRLLAPIGVDLMSDLRQIRQTLDTLETPMEDASRPSESTIESGSQ